MKKQQIITTIILSILLISLIICQFLLIKTSSNKNNKSQNLNEYLINDKETMTYGKTQQKIKSTKNYSYAINYPKTKNNKIDEQIKIIIEREIKILKKKVNIDKNNDTLIINYEIYKHEDLISLVLIKKYLSDSIININTYIFEENNGMIINNIIDKDKFTEFQNNFTISSNFIALNNNEAIFYTLENNEIKKTNISIKEIKNYLTINTTELEESNSRNIDLSKPMVALTFDDGPHPIYGPRIIETLKKHNTVATFFEVGYMLEKYSNVSISAKEIGCEIGSHTYDHINLKKVTEQERIDELKQMDDLYFSIFNEYPKLLRPPYGAYVNELTNITNEAIILWSIDTNDWQYRDKDKIINHIKEQGNLDGDVILMHSTYKETADAIEELVPWLIEQGYQLVTITELIENKYNTNTNNEKIFGYYYFGN